MHYDNQTISARFASPNSVQPNILEMELDSVWHIEDNAFTGGAFSQVINLTITKLSALTLGPNTFNGLDSLRSLYLLNMQLAQMPDCLHGVSKNLQHLVVTGSDSRNQFQLDYLLSGVKLPTLMHVHFLVNLRNSIKAYTLNSTRLTTIHLAYCLIEHIDSNAFHPIRESIREINLAGNFLKTLPTGMLSYLLPRDSLVIDLTNNPWDCGCHLSELQKNLLSYQYNFRPNVTCITPNEFNSQPINNASFCGPIDDENDEILSNFVVVQCPSISGPVKPVEQIVLLREVKFLVARFKIDHFSGLYITPHEDGENMRMVAFTVSRPEIMFVDYRCGCQKSAIRLDGRLVPELNYMLCVQDTSTRRTIAQNCIAYHHGKWQHSVWLRKTDRLLAGFVLTGILLLFLIGGGLLPMILYNWLCSRQAGPVINSPSRCEFR